MRIFTGDHVGLLKLTDTNSKTVSFPNEAQCRPAKLREDLAIVSMCFGDDDEKRLCYVRKTGTLEIVSLLESDDVRPCLAIKLPAEPFFITRLKKFGRSVHLLIVCRTGEILQVDFDKLLAHYEKHVVKATDKFWPLIQQPKTENSDISDRDWRLNLDVSPWFNNKLNAKCQPLSLKCPEDYYPCPRPADKCRACKLKVEMENSQGVHPHTIDLVKEEAPTPNSYNQTIQDDALVKRAEMILEDVVVGFGKLFRKKPVYVETASVYRNVAGDIILLLGGQKMYLRAVKVSLDGHFEVVYFAKARQDALNQWENLSCKCVGHLGVVNGVDWIYSIDQDGRLMIYDPPNREALVVFQSTFDKKCPSLSAVLTNLKDEKSFCMEDSTTDEETGNEQHFEDSKCESHKSNSGNNAKEKASSASRLVRKLLVADNKGQSYILKITFDPGSEFSVKRMKKRAESGYLEQYFVRSKKKARVNPAYVPKMKSIIEYRDEQTADSLFIKGHGRLLGLEGSILCAAVTPERESIVLGGLSRKLFVFSKPIKEWKITDKVYLKNKIYSMLISQNQDN